jgi:hypothetical protein
MAVARSARTFALIVFYHAPRKIIGDTGVVNLLICFTY